GGFYEPLVLQPLGASTLERDEVPDARQLRADAINGLEIILVRADDARAAMVDDVGEIVGRQAEVDRHEHGPDLRNRVERLQLRVRVGRDVDDPVALPDAE